MPGRPIRADAFMQALHRLAERSALAEGVPADQAGAIAARLQLEVRRELGGVQAYIAQDRPTVEQQVKRAAELSEAGYNARDICSRLGVSRRRCYELLRQARTGRR